jgi:hypothetical protein
MSQAQSSKPVAVQEAVFERFIVSHFLYLFTYSTFGEIFRSGLPQAAGSDKIARTSFLDGQPTCVPWGELVY